MFILIFLMPFSILNTCLCCKTCIHEVFFVNINLLFVTVYICALRQRFIGKTGPAYVSSLGKVIIIIVFTLHNRPGGILNLNKLQFIYSCMPATFIEKSDRRLSLNKILKCITIFFKYYY
jgi:hypothetical protein